MSPAFVLEEWQVRMVLPHRPPVLQLDRAECPAGLAGLQAVKAVGGSDPMMRRGLDGPAHLAPGALIEALAQCCGLLLRLRWLAEQGADLVAFASGDNDVIAHHDIPRSVLADSHARFTSFAVPSQALRLKTTLSISRGDMHRFVTAADGVVTAQISLKFPYAL
jgi:3-hydroxymyristoyl/3-hydroxydecanoyl-(acyl carrier protein) dehydratase